MRGLVFYFPSQANFDPVVGNVDLRSLKQYAILFTPGYLKIGASIMMR